MACGRVGTFSVTDEYEGAAQQLLQRTTLSRADTLSRSDRAQYAHGAKPLSQPRYDTAIIKSDEHCISSPLVKGIVNDIGMTLCSFVFDKVLVCLASTTVLSTQYFEDLVSIR